jgi:hypothetical protein
LTLYFTLGFFMVNTFLSRFIRIFPTSKWWSDAASAPLLTQTSWSDHLLNLFFFNTTFSNISVISWL